MPFRAWRCAGAMALAWCDIALRGAMALMWRTWTNLAKTQERATNARRTRRDTPERCPSAMALARRRGVQTVTRWRCASAVAPPTKGAGNPKRDLRKMAPENNNNTKNIFKYILSIQILKGQKIYYKNIIKYFYK